MVCLNRSQSGPVLVLIRSVKLDLEALVWSLPYSYQNDLTCEQLRAAFQKLVGVFCSYSRTN
jgi:hypothetical protein